MIATSASVFDSLSVLADPVRCRLLLLLERRELSVAELVQSMQLPQSTISRHLKALAEEGLVSGREEGASNRYSMRLDGIGQPVRRLWNVLREQTAELAGAEEDSRRLASVLSERRTRSQAYFSSAAGQWDRIRRELFGENTHLHALLSLFDDSWVVGDLGAGTGHVALALAPFVKRVIAVDDSAAMLAAARKRLANSDNVELRRGDITQLPVEDGELDVAVLHLVLPFVDEPRTALREVFRVLKPGGRVLIVDMIPHEREDLAREMGHVWRGFSADQLREWTDAEGFSGLRFHPLPPDPAAKGPGLFAAVVGKGAHD
jgi:ubiquinone/menaquinone biosynthesis C-methylase UbiE/DNA-binding transcriptional ArsR family regulator